MKFWVLLIFFEYFVIAEYDSESMNRVICKWRSVFWLQLKPPKICPVKFWKFFTWAPKFCARIIHFLKNFALNFETSKRTFLAAELVCTERDMQLHILVEKPLVYPARIFVKDQSRNPLCSLIYPANADHNALMFRVPLSTCDMKRVQQYTVGQSHSHLYPRIVVVIPFEKATF